MVAGNIGPVYKFHVEETDRKSGGEGNNKGNAWKSETWEYSVVWETV